MESLLGAKSMEKAIEVQREFVKTAYQEYLAYASKLGELYTNLAKETFKPYEGVITKRK
jgi:hypothetical protein